MRPNHTVRQLNGTRHMVNVGNETPPLQHRVADTRIEWFIRILAVLNARCSRTNCRCNAFLLFPAQHLMSALLSRLAPPIPINSIFSIGFFTNIPATIEAKGRRLLSIFSDFVLPVNSPHQYIGQHRQHITKVLADV